MTCWQPPTFTFSPLSCLNGDIYNEVILTGHPILLFITFLSVNEQSLFFFSCHPMKSLTPALLCLSGEETPASVILSVVTTHQVQNGTWPGFPLLLPPLQFFLFGVFFFLEPLQCLFCRPSVKPTFAWGTDILNNDRWKTWGRTRCNDKVETLDRNRQVRL